MYEDLQGKVAIITGAARANGIGQGIAKRFAREGCRVVVADVAMNDLDQRKSEIEAMGVECLAARCDVTDEASAQAMVDAAVQKFGRVDILANNVGGAMMNQVGPVIEMNSAAWDSAMALNAKGTHLCSRAVAKQMIAQGQGGKIVNTSSQAGIHPEPGIGLYSCAKALINQYTRILAIELSPHKINVNAVLPGTIMTDKLREVLEGLSGMKNASDEELGKLLPPIPWGRLETPDDVASAVVWLASKQSDYITGECLLVTGGQTMD
jgi:NAD(P)-dependent dehydrogenase (short-subunit alcohol dehydrogenase family)